ncbi:hypothetical protein J3458_020731 [Metarhizium acridum]|uniref:uncharacterized protein n=1 Tax=Metarhizium acridum TaxID=92637 RepID=UPI001C6AAAD7|nr:hypothetical protein J3458_020731 [Metarhizium acridum]
MSPASADIPIIDLSGPQEDVAKQLVDAAADHGFIYIQNLGHDIPAASIDDAFALSKKLFSAPLDEKQACSIQTNNRGWTSMHAETLDPQNQKVLTLAINPLHHVAIYAERLLRVTRWEISKSEQPRIHKPLDRRPSRPNLDLRAFNFGEFINNKAQQPLPPTVAADEARFSAFADLCAPCVLKSSPS